MISFRLWMSLKVVVGETVAHPRHAYPDTPAVRAGRCQPSVVGLW